MHDPLRKFGATRSFAETCMDGVSALAAQGFGPGSENGGHLLCYFPEDRNNPFHKMLYSQSLKNGFVCFPVDRIEDVISAPRDVQLVLHVHWVHRIFDEVHNKAEARAATWQFLNQIETAQSEGHKVLWTVHNKLSHNSMFPNEEYHLRASMAERVDVIHVMNPASVEACQPEYLLPSEKILQINHPSYVGVYGDYISKLDARFQLGLSHEEPVFLLFGKMVPQKGARQFLGQMDAIQAKLNGKARFLLAGRESSPEFTEEIITLTAGRSDIFSIRSYIADNDVQLYFRAADVVVCPYQQGLNSGVVMTAASFGCPVVTSDIVARSLDDISDYVMQFQASDMGGIVDCCVTAYMKSQEAGTESAILKWAKECTPHKISQKFFTSLRDVL